MIIKSVRRRACNMRVLPLLLLASAAAVSDVTSGTRGGAAKRAPVPLFSVPLPVDATKVVKPGLRIKIPGAQITPDGVVGAERDAGVFALPSPHRAQMPAQRHASAGSSR